MNITGRVSHFFALNRPLSILFLLVALVFGLISFLLTPKQYNPEITRPAFAVSVQYQGSTIEGAIDRVVYELVEKVDTVPGVDDIFTEVRDGATINTTVIFEVGYDAAKAKIDLLSQLEQHSYLARGNINKPTVMEVNPETLPVLQIVFGAPGLTIPELRAMVTRLSQRLNLIEDVSELKVYGGYVGALTVEIDPNLLVASNSTLDMVMATLKESQLRLVTSGVRNQPYVMDIVFDGLVTSPEMIGDLVLPNGVNLRDVAHVYEGAGNDRSYIFYQNKEKQGEVVLLSVAKVEGSSAPVVTAAVLASLDSVLLEPEFSGLEYRVVSNDGETAKQEIFGLTANLVTSIAIVSVVLLLFLSTRAAVVVLVAIPVTLLIVFGLGFLFDQTINRITLFALILSLGLLVDSAIVAVENIYSHFAQWRKEPSGKTREQVIAGAIDEIGVGLLLSTVTSVVVFLPMSYITGMMGPYMGPIAFFVPAALTVSFLVAIIVTPFIANYILHVDVKHNRIAQIFMGGMERLTLSYTKLLQKIVYNEKLQKLILKSAVFLFLISLVLPIFGLVHFQMLPRADRDQFYVYLDLPVGTDREETRKMADKVSSIILADGDVLDVQQFVATPPILDFNGMFKGAQARGKDEQATLRVNLTSAGERERSSTDIVTAVRAEVGRVLPNVASSVRFMEEPPGPPVRATLVAKISADDQVIQYTAAAAFKEFISGIEGVVDTYQSDESSVSRIRYVFDYAAAEALGVTPSSVLMTLNLLGGTYEVTEFLSSDAVEYTPVILTLPTEYRLSPNFIDTVMVKSTTGEDVPLRSVLVLSHEARPSAVYLEDVRQLSYVTAEVEERSIVYVTIEIIKKLINGDFAAYRVEEWSLWGVTLATIDGVTVSLDWGGEWEMTLENFRDLGIAMGVALFMVYVLLVAQYGKFSTPAYILVTVPLGLVGILWGFLLLDTAFNTYLTATALIGFIALIGIVVNNAILFLEYVEQREAAGVSYREALVQAGETRLRPIFLTSLTTVLGSLTIAGDPVWSGLAWAIVFGLSLSTILTLIIYPTLLARFVAPRS